MWPSAVLTHLCISSTLYARGVPLPPTRAFKASQGKQLYSGAEIWPATISHCTNTGLGWLTSDWLSPRPCDSRLAGCSPATDTVDGLLGWRLSLEQNGVSLRLTPWSLVASVQMCRLLFQLFSTEEIIARLFVWYSKAVPISLLFWWLVIERVWGDVHRSGFWLYHGDA